MSPLTLYLAKLIGSVLVVLALWMALRRERMLGLANALMADPNAIFWVGVLRLTAGLALVIGHDVWSGGALAIVITLLGWVMLANGLLTLFLPHEKLVAVFEAMGLEKHYSSYAGGVLLFGLYLLIGGYLG